jgi:muramoyltetrapeptide carboxypeptidase
MKDTTRPFGKSIEEMITEHVSDYNYPVCFGFPVGHEKENLAMKISATYKLKVEKNKVILSE